MNQRVQIENIDFLSRLALHQSPRLRELTAHLAALNFDAADPTAVGQTFHALVNTGFDDLPNPSSGQTAERWNRIAAVAGRDLNLVKLFEGHTDALAILTELGDGRHQPGWYWGVWAAESPEARVTATPTGEAEVVLNGVKSWCSGAAVLSHALVTGWEPDGTAGLYAVALDRPGITLNGDIWKAVGMHPSASVEVHFDRASAIRVAAGNAYFERPGFWHGGAGIAACWFGAAVTLGQVVMREAELRPDPHRSAHLGHILAAVGSAAASLREAAAAIDRMPRANVRWIALRTRLCVEHAAGLVLQHAGRALGAATLCHDAQVARLMADLPVFMRQSHAERDLAALGEFHAQRDGNNRVLSDLLEESRLWQI